MTGIIERTTVKGTLNRPTKPNVQISAIIIGTRVAKTWRKLRNMAYKSKNQLKHNGSSKLKSLRISLVME